MRPAPSVAALALLLAGCMGRPASLTSALGLKPVELPGALEPFYSDGKRQLAAGNYGLAIDQFRRAVRADPHSVDAFNGLAVAYARAGRHDLARRYFEVALGLAPDSDVVANNLGYALLAQGEAAAAGPLLVRAASSADPAVSNKGKRNLALARSVAMASPPVVRGDVPPEPRRPIRIVRLSLDRQVLLTRDETLSTGDAPAGQSAQLSPPIIVANGTGRFRLAARYGAYLQGRGFRIEGRANAPARLRSEIRFTPAQEDDARALAATLPFTPVLTRVAGTFAGLRLELGRDALAFDRRLRGTSPDQRRKSINA